MECKNRIYKKKGNYFLKENNRESQNKKTIWKYGILGIWKKNTFIFLIPRH